jgi:hypothetical protein
MFKRLLLLLLIALLPLQGVAASFMRQCPALALGQASQHTQSPCHDAMDFSADPGATTPCHTHESGALNLNADHCCPHLALAIPQNLTLPQATLARAQTYPPLVAFYTDPLPARLQRPPLSLLVF